MIDFSIIIPAYNVERYLQECLNSIERIDYENYEVILVDDGSTDRTGDICERYAARNSKIRVIHQENQGSSGARNTGLKQANGEWILFIDSDDYIEKELLSCLKREICKSEADIYSFNARKVTEDSKEIELLLYSIENKIYNLKREEKKFWFYFEILLQYQIGWEACLKAFKREIILSHNIQFYPIREIFAEDYLFTYEYMLHVERFGALCNIFYNYRQRENSLIHTVDYSSVIPRLYHLAETAYDKTKKSGYKYLKREFYQIYFIIFHFHIKYLLKDVPLEQIREQIEELKKYKLHRKLIKKIQKDEFLMGMLEDRKWL